VSTLASRFGQRRELTPSDPTDANPRFYDISGVDPNGSLADWRSCIMEEYQANVEKAWREATALKPKHHHKPAAVATTMEFRWKRDQNWVLFELVVSCFGVSSTAADLAPLFSLSLLVHLSHRNRIRPFSEGGIHRGFVGSITDISSQKRVEQLHIQEVERRAADAEENRRQTDQFLDMSSHELRNRTSRISASSCAKACLLMRPLARSRPTSLSLLAHLPPSNATPRSHPPSNSPQRSVAERSGRRRLAREVHRAD